MTDLEYRVLDLRIKVIGTILVMLTFGWTVYAFNESYRRLFYTSHWNKKVEVCGEICAAAAKLAGDNDTNPADQDKFWVLYNGQLLFFVDDKPILAAADNYAKILNDWNKIEGVRPHWPNHELLAAC
jgi:hypothetical protein